MVQISVILRDEMEEAWRRLKESTDLQDEALEQIAHDLLFEYFRTISAGNQILIADKDGKSIAKIQLPHGKIIVPFE
jgi:hypothetical protein